jgi:hypothetical protein
VCGSAARVPVLIIASLYCDDKLSFPMLRDDGLRYRSGTGDRDSAFSGFGTSRVRVRKAVAVSREEPAFVATCCFL